MITTENVPAAAAPESGVTETANVEPTANVETITNIEPATATETPKPKRSRKTTATATTVAAATSPVPAATSPAPRNDARNKKGQKTAMKTTTRSARVPRFATQVLNAAKALLRTPQFSALLRDGAASPAARRGRPTASTARTAARTARRQRRAVPDPVRSYAKARRKVARSSSHGRTPGVYFPAAKVTSVNGSESMKHVFGLISRRAKKGISQRQIVETLEVPNSTVWYALQELRAQKAVEYRDAE